MNKRKKILILGITGQDGSFLAKYLISKKYLVHGLVRKSATGNLSNIKSLINLLKLKNYIFAIDYLRTSEISKTYEIKKYNEAKYFIQFIVASILYHTPLPYLTSHIL